MAYPSLFNEALIKADMEAKTKEEALQSLASVLISNGYVRESFTKAVLDREGIFPTGLSTEDIGVAIPHADKEHVIKPGIAVAVLKSPIKFNVMENPREETDVRIIFMLALTDSNLQIGALKNIIAIIQDKELLSKLINTKDIKEVMRLLQSGFTSIVS